MKLTSIVISSLKHLCFVSFFVQIFICSGCKTSNSGPSNRLVNDGLSLPQQTRYDSTLVPNNRLVNERLSSIEIPALIMIRVDLGTMVDYLNSAMEECGPRERDGGKRNIVFECSHSLRKREIESVPLDDTLPFGYGKKLWMPMSDFIDEICLRARVDFVIIGNRGVFVERKTSAQASKNGTE